MKRLKLLKGLSYTARDINCKKGEPFLVSDEQAEKLLATGRFAIVGNVVDGTSPVALPATPAMDPSIDPLANGAGGPLVNGNGEGGQQTALPATPAMDPSIDPLANGAGGPLVNGNGEGGQQTALPAAPQLSADKISRMTKPELIALAEEKGIDIAECNNNTERVERICGVLGLVSTMQLGLE